MIKKVFIVSDGTHKEKENFLSLKEHIFIHYKLEVDDFYFKDIIYEVKAKSLYLLYLSDLQIKQFFKQNINQKINIAIIPTQDSQRAAKSYGVSKDIYEAIDDALDEKNLTNIDLLVCNGEPTFTNIVIGDVHGLNKLEIEDKSIFLKIKDFVDNLKNLNFKDYTITTSKEQTIQTAATGIMVLEHNVKQSNYNFINDDLSLHDGKLNAFILAPTSIISYIYYLILVFFYSRFSINTMPKNIGIIKTSKLNIKSSKPIDFKVDGVYMSAKEIELEVLKDSFNLSLGRYVKDIAVAEITEEGKDTIRTNSLPKNEIRSLLIEQSIPLFKKASDEDFKELFIGLRESAKLSSVFIVLMILSTMLATTGLFQSSAPVIIGAMILAPLMAPIVSLSMGVVRGENDLISNSTKTLFFGIVTALLFSCLYSYFMPLNTLTNEMRGRLNPNILDLMVAIISGIAGAYANSKSEVAKSLAGVAIAVALVPPLSVTGIGIGWGDFNVIYGSFLLFITNLVGITLAASLTFIVLGYAPINRAKKGLAYSIIILAVVIVPLVISFYKVIEQNNILTKLNHKAYVVNGKKLDIDIFDVDLSKEYPTIIIQTQSNEILNKDDYKVLKEKIEEKIGQKAILNISSRMIVQ